ESGEWRTPFRIAIQIASKCERVARLIVLKKSERCSAKHRMCVRGIDTDGVRAGVSLHGGAAGVDSDDRLVGGVRGVVNVLNIAAAFEKMPDPHTGILVGVATADGRIGGVIKSLLNIV